MQEMKQKEMAKALGVSDAAISLIKYNHPKRYHLYKLGIQNLAEKKDSTLWQSIKKKDMAKYLDYTLPYLFRMSKIYPKRYELLARGFVVLNY